MNFLIIQEKGRHEANAEFREALNLKRALIKCGHSCEVWGLNYENFHIPFQQLADKADVIILLENYETGNWIPDLSAIRKLKMFWSIDSHCVPEQHVNTCNRHKIDHVLCAIEHHQSLFKKQRTSWFPNAYPDDLIDYRPAIEKKYDIGFCGSELNRADWINLLKSEFNLHSDIFVIGEKMVEAINSYTIHFNRNLADDINFRTFETLGCKTFLLTNVTPGLDKLFTVGKHLETYNNGKDLIEKVKYYLGNRSELNTIAEAGYQHVRSHHTYVNRAQTLISLTESMI